MVRKPTGHCLHPDPPAPKGAVVKPWCIMLMLNVGLLTSGHFVMSSKFVIVRMLQRSLGCHPLGRFIVQHFRKQIQRLRVKGSAHCSAQGLWFPLWKDVTVIWERCDIGPRVFIGGPEKPEDLVELINLGISWEQSLLRGHFSKYAPNAPDVDCWAVMLVSQENLRCAVPKSDHFVRVCVKGHLERPCQSEICELDCLKIL
mmetsp:Transcript_56192/g.93393  ORF Transcript_56192/g.93393 Transcript_56192/m.93393 type:complete len:201 (+) Transcript_56192:1175-1777(+)